MISSEHQAVVRLFGERPALAAELLRGALHVPVPDYDHVELETGDLTEVTPSELHADSVIVFSRKQPDADPKPVLAVVVEVQRGRDRGKRWSWPMYVVSLRTRMKCPTTLLVVCPDAAIARWCAKPIELGHPGFTLIPLVAGPAVIPVITDPEQAAEDPELAALSAITHADTPQAADILDALIAAIHDLDPQQGALYADMVRAALSPETWEHLEMLMKTENREYLSEWARANVAKGEAQGMAKGKAEGMAKGKAEAVLAVLSARGLDVPEDVRDEITACTDSERLDTWIRAAVTISSARTLLEHKG